MSLINSMMLSTNMIFLFTKHPMSMGLTLIAQTIMMSMLSGFLMKSFWISYMLLITVLSGMLVLFMYMASVASNEKFKFKVSMLYMYITLTAVMWLILSQSNSMVIKNNYLGMELNPNNMMELFNLNKMFSCNMIITMILVMYLFFTMIVASYIVNTTEGPLRMSK